MSLLIIKILSKFYCRSLEFEMKLLALEPSPRLVINICFQLLYFCYVILHLSSFLTKFIPLTNLLHKLSHIPGHRPKIGAVGMKLGIVCWHCCRPLFQSQETPYNTHIWIALNLAVKDSKNIVEMRLLLILFSNE